LRLKTLLLVASMAGRSGTGRGRGGGRVGGGRSSTPDDKKRKETERRPLVKKLIAALVLPTSVYGAPPGMAEDVISCVPVSVVVSILGGFLEMSVDKAGLKSGVYSETLSALKKEAHVDTGRSVSTVLTHSRLAHFGVLKELEAVVEALKDGGEAVASAFRDKDITAFNLELNGELKAGLPK
jgi:hypothetical protein